jgi:hypothetical protein
MSISTTNLAALSSDRWDRTCPCLYPLSRRRRWSRATLLCRQTTLTLLEKNRSTRSLRWLLTPNSIHTDIICMKPPPRVHSDHVGRPDHSAGHAVSDDRRRGKHDQHCTGWYADGGFAILRGPYRRTRSRPLVRPRVVPCSGRRGRLVHNLRRSAQTVIYTYQNPASRPCPLSWGKIPSRTGLHGPVEESRQKAAPRSGRTT